MREQEIIEGNKLIAEFMGAKIEQGGNDEWYAMDIPLPDGTLTGIHLKDLKYNSSWEWLMKVVEKIIPEFRPRAVNKKHPFFLIQYNLIQANGKESVWLAVVDFIKWHNDNK